MSRVTYRTLLSCLALLCLARPQFAQTVHRPKILGISAVHFVSSDLPADSTFLRTRLSLLGDSVMSAVAVDHSTFFLPTGQVIFVSKVPSPPPFSFLADITFLVDNLSQLRSYLAQNHVVCREIPPFLHLGGPIISLSDPEGHTLHFTANPPSHISFSGSPQLIHAGIIVHDREAVDRFYKGILGFHLYWEGGKAEGASNWVAMQVPDGTSWIEYMMNEDSSGKKQRGNMNHISIGVPNIKELARNLNAAGVQLNPNEQPQMGLDGKWQLNLYDPDGTRVELMEFTPVEKPCCSEYTGPHPKP